MPGRTRSCESASMAKAAAETRPIFIDFPFRGGFSGRVEQRGVTARPTGRRAPRSMERLRPVPAWAKT